MSRLVFLDTETTGGSRSDRIIEIGMVEVVDWELTGRRFHSYFMTDQPIHWAAKRVHGIGERDLVGKPRFADLADEVLGFLEGSLSFAHNAPFDGGMLRKEWDDINLPAMRRPDIICTLPIAGALGSAKKLDDLISRYLPGHPPRGHHSAVEDADLLAQVFLRMRESAPSVVDGFLKPPAAQRPQRSSKPNLFDARPAASAPSPAPVLTGVNEAVSEQIGRANREGSVSLAIEIRTGRDQFSRMGAQELFSLLGDKANAAEEAPEGRRLSAMRMMARGLDPHLAVEREKHFFSAYPMGPGY